MKTTTHQDIFIAKLEKLIKLKIKQFNHLDQQHKLKYVDVIRHMTWLEHPLT